MTMPHDFYIGVKPSPATCANAASDQQLIQQYNTEGYNMVLLPITNSKYRDTCQTIFQASFPAAVPSPKLSEVNLLPGTHLANTIGLVASWIELESGEPSIASFSRKVFEHELAYASYIGLTHVIIAPPKDTQQLANYSNTVAKALMRFPRLNLSISLPMCEEVALSASSAPDFLSTWEMWNSLRVHCDYPANLSISLALPKSVVPPYVVSRWLAEPIVCLLISLSSFLINAKQYPVLAKSNQRIITALLGVPRPPLLLLHGIERCETVAGEKGYYNYLRFLLKKVSPCEEDADVLRPPLEPIRGQLSDEVYSLFEGDTTKYEVYGRAIELAVDELWGKLPKKAPKSYLGTGQTSSPNPIHPTFSRSRDSEATAYSSVSESTNLFHSPVNSGFSFSRSELDQPAGWSKDLALDRSTSGSPLPYSESIRIEGVSGVSGISKKYSEETIETTNLFPGIQPFGLPVQTVSSNGTIAPPQSGGPGPLKTPSARPTSPVLSESSTGDSDPSDWSNPKQLSAAHVVAESPFSQAEFNWFPRPPTQSYGSIPSTPKDPISLAPKDSVPLTPKDSIPSTPKDSIPLTPKDSAPLTLVTSPLGDNYQYRSGWKFPAATVTSPDGLTEGDSPPSALRVAILGAGRGPLVHQLFQALDRLNLSTSSVQITAVEKNPHALIHLYQKNRDLWGSQVTITAKDMRQLSGTFDLVISELLGSFGCNELSPECLHGVNRMLSPGGICIPRSYQSYIAPAFSPRMYSLVGSLGEEGKKRWHQGYVVNIKSMDVLSRIHKCWEFTHGESAKALPGNGTNYGRNHTSSFNVHHKATIHGLVGYFTAVLYPGIYLSTNPQFDPRDVNNKSPGVGRVDLNVSTPKTSSPVSVITPTLAKLFSKGITPNLRSWYPMWLPLETPLHVLDDTEVEVNIRRQCEDERVWYEWSLESYIYVVSESGNDEAMARVKTGVTKLHNPGGIHSSYEV
ncbi:hypothetical protein BABINDRAFT_161310 [Babjeviella inositovora NRRL Y-12698]|uniref:Protein arginine N-methyltransferase n=1 Tax=Babjeviella inositovora NRRL Y-12698 TaxID=984486 RepID=A0A1E3QRS0_9ASCO|nr:uncharacterized protein BABINDRAFT_161310 [Babjeviella inositovora NRRL Y-12698]ODQ80360.1 hypothetical protein BABINDRAFT_161310 [Babjeviella inositovora NRRL Y-12698]